MISSISKRILENILKDPEYWQWSGAIKTSELIAPRLAAIRRTYYQTWESLWVEEIYFDQFARAEHLLKIIAPKEYTDSHYVNIFLDGEEHTGLDCDNCIYDLQLKLTDYTEWWLRQHQQEWGYLAESFFDNEDNVMQFGIFPQRQLTLSF